MELKDRLTDLASRSELSRRQIALKAGVSPVNFYRWLDGAAEPDDKNLAMLCDYFNVTPAWLRYGEQDIELPQTLDIGEGELAIPLYNVEASCGEGPVAEAYDMVTLVRVKDAFLDKYCKGANPHHLHIITARGDSMQPTISAGDLLLVDTSQKFIGDDGLYVFCFQGNLIVKRVQVRPSSYMLISDNKDLYQPFEATKEELNVIGRVYVTMGLRTH